MKAMKRLFVLIAAVLSCGLASAQNTGNQNYIEVNGKAEMEVVPDEIYIAITINEKDNKGKVSIDQQEKAMFRSLKSLGIDLETDMTVQDMSSDLKTYLLRKDAVMTSKSYQLKVGSAAMLGKVFQALASEGIADARVIRTDVSNLEELRQQVRAEAAKAARMNAETLAGALGQSAGKAIYIQDLSYNARPYSNVMLMAKSASADAANGVEEAMPQLEFEKVRIEHSVMVRFKLEE